MIDHDRRRHYRHRGDHRLNGYDRLDDLLDHGDPSNIRRDGDPAATLGESRGGEHGGEHRRAHPQNCAMERHDTPYSSTIAPIRRRDDYWNESC